MRKTTTIFNKNVQRVELGKLKGNEGNQNYVIPAGTDLSKYKAVSIYCERFNANFGTAPLDRGVKHACKQRVGGGALQAHVT